MVYTGLCSAQSGKLHPPQRWFVHRVWHVFRCHAAPLLATSQPLRVLFAGLGIAFRLVLWVLPGVYSPVLYTVV